MYVCQSLAKLFNKSTAPTTITIKNNERSEIMDFVCKKNDLEYALNYATRAAASKSTSSILECVLLTASAENGISLIGTDSQISINTAPFSAEVDKEGSIALNSKLFYDIVRKLPGDLIRIEADDKLRTIMTSGKSVLKMSGLSSYDFPLVVEEDLVAKEKFKINANTLKDMIRQTIFSVSTDPTKLVLTGELMEIKEQILRVVAIDMFRISYRAEKVTENNYECKAVVPARALGELSRMVPSEKDEEMEFFFTDKKAVFIMDDFRMVANLLHGDFIRYDQIFNSDFSTKVNINREMFLFSCERVMLLSSEGKPINMKISIGDEELLVYAITEKGEVNDVISCTTDGKELTIYFNPRYFSEVLRAIETENITIKFNSVMSPCTISLDDDNPNFKYLIVPLRPPQ